ncbi:MAG: sugar ABC transporter permease [Caldilineaceae bacterium]|nr:sugar ABC transporter permease [Caldilineaceae bacterium]MDE0180680.1 sugar ABC transporter permease [Caldilineaceae bacterium]
MNLSLRKQEIIWGYIFVAPWVIGAAVLLAWPLLRSLLLSFENVRDLINLQTEWVGLANYTEAFREDVGFLPRLLSSVRDLALNLPLILVFSMMMALLVTGVNRGQTFLRAVFFLPVVIGSSGVITELLEAGAGDMIIDSTMERLMAGLGESTGEEQGIVAPVQVVVERLTLIIWHTGVQILLFIAGLNSIPPSLYEAARVDGSTGWEAFWKITLPMLSPVMLVAAIYTVIDSFTDPLNSVVNYIMDISLREQLRLGYGAALSWVYFIVVFLLILLLVRLSSRLVFYMGDKQ